MHARLFQERALPDLGDNIKCGNSLIGPDFYEQGQLAFFDEEERYRINVFDWATEFAAIMKGGGFDAVIGNPPYVVLGGDADRAAVVAYLSRFAVAQYKTDLFHLFIQRGLDLLKRGGQFGFIVPNPWLTMKFTDQLRRYILGSGIVREVVVFEHLVFVAADVYTALLFVEKAQPTSEHKVRVIKPLQAVGLVNAQVDFVPQREWAESDGYIFETRLIGKVGKLVKKLKQNWPVLESVARASLGCQAYNSSKHTREQIANRVFHASAKISDEYLQELAGNDAGRYEINRRRGEWIKYGPWLHDYRPMDWLQGPRLLVREIAGKQPYQIYGCYVEETYCNYKTILNVNPSDKTDFSMKYLLGLINSRLISFLYPYVSNKMVARGFPRISVGDLKQLPIRTINFNDPSDRAHHDRMVALVDVLKPGPEWYSI